MVDTKKLCTKTCLNRVCVEKNHWQGKEYTIFPPKKKKKKKKKNLKWLKWTSSVLKYLSDIKTFDASQNFCQNPLPIENPYSKLICGI